MRNKHSLYSYALGTLLETLEGLFAKKSWQFSKMAGQVIRERRGEVYVVLSPALCVKHRFRCKEICCTKTLENIASSLFFTTPHTSTLFLKIFFRN